MKTTRVHRDAGGDSGTAATSMIRVAHVITGLKRGGAEMMLQRLISASDPTCFSHLVVSLTPGGAVAPLIEAAGAPVHHIAPRRAALPIAAVRRLPALLRSEGIDVVQTWLYHADLIGSLAAALAGVRPVLWNIRCVDPVAAQPSRSMSLVMQLLARGSRYPDAVVVNSATGMEHHRRLGYAPRRWELIPNGFDVDAFRPIPEAAADVRREIGIAPDRPLVGLIARYDALKDHPNFLRAARLVLEQRGDVSFLLAGGGIDATNAQLMREIQELGLRDAVHLLGERRDVSRLCASLTVSVSSSIGEGFPNAVGEAMACGVPCVVTDVGDSALLVADAGAIVPPSDSNALADGIVRVLNMPDAERNALGLAARRRIVENYTLAAITRRYESLYAELAAARRGLAA